MSEIFLVNHKRKALKFIPYIGCKAGFSHIFDALIPNEYGSDKIYDVFGGGGGFSLYACARFGSQNVVYNDHNPTVTNLMMTLKEDPDGLWAEYQRHRTKSDTDYYLKMRKLDLGNGLEGAGRFFYLTKNAFSGKIRFNSKNEFNSPMRKNTKCPHVKVESLRFLSDTIKHMIITNEDFTNYEHVTDGFVYLDPPYMNNPNAHYNAIVLPEAFTSFVKTVEKSNRVMISEQNKPESLDLGDNYTIYHVRLGRSLQYFTQNESSEIVAINYSPPRLNSTSYE